MKKFAVLSLSGGMDSSSLLLHLLSQGYNVTCVSFDYGQKHSVELVRASQLIFYLRQQGFDEERLVFNVIELKGLSDLLYSSLVNREWEVPEGEYGKDNMESTVVPNRNKIFSSIIQSIALSISLKNPGCKVDISMGLHSGDHTTYPDTTETFRNKDYEAFVEGNWDTDFVHYETPFIQLDKAGVLQKGVDACSVLKLDVGEVYRKTMTSYKPVHINGKFYSDCLSASSRERISAFVECGIEDPVEYAHNNKPVTWEEVLKIVKENSND